MRTRWRSMRDVVAFVMRREWVYAVASVAVILSLAPLLPGWPQWASGLLAAVGLLVGLQAFFRDTRHLLRRWSSWRFREIVPAFEHDGLPGVPGLNQFVIAERGAVAISTDLDSVLSTTQLPLRVVEDPYVLPAALADASAYMLRRTTSARWRFNGACVRLDSDLSVESAAGGTDVMCRPASFFDGLCSNELTGWEVHRDGVLWNFSSEHLLDSSGRLLALSQSQLANMIGVSTVAITTDSHLLLTLQSRGSSASAQLWAPSGSGSLEPQDLRGQTWLQRAVTAGMERELHEECGLLPSDVVSTRVIGYGRWLDRGGKPEFYGVSTLSVTLNEAMSRRSRQRDEKMWTQCVDSARLDLSSEPHSEQPARWQDVVCDHRRMRGSMSVSLEANLAALVQAVRRSPELADGLVKQSPGTPGEAGRFQA